VQHPLTVYSVASAIGTPTFAAGTTGYDISGASGATTVVVRFTTTPNQAQEDFAAVISNPVLNSFKCRIYNRQYNYLIR
jgi:hypothetical protein